MKRIPSFILVALLVGGQLFAQQVNELKLEIYQIKVSLGHATLIVLKDTRAKYEDHISF